ncbi:MAG TPA: hypothetical protein VGZ47_10995 [Gemmataceae bacterium]|nr:hypothetical protein [Gemmataceae bacterium]
MSRALSLVVALLTIATAFAQPKGGEVQPDRIAFGTVHTGSIVEASFMMLELGTDANIPLTVTAPKFVKVLHKATEARQYGPGNDFIAGRVEIAIDTSAAAQLKDEITVTLGKTTGKVPVSATVKPRRPAQTRLLIAETPFQCYSSKDGGIFQEWTDLVARTSLDASYLLVTRGKSVLRDLNLGEFDTVLLGESGLYDMTPADLKRVREFAETGGRVIVSANHFFRGTVEKANKVVEGYGLQMRDEEANGNDKNDVTLQKEELDKTLVKAGVNSLHFFRASPVAITNANGRVIVKAVGVGEAKDGFVAIGRAGKGEVAVIGESLWWSWISAQRAGDTDNAKLLRWLIVPRKREL